MKGETFSKWIKACQYSRGIRRRDISRWDPHRFVFVAQFINGRAASTPPFRPFHTIQFISIQFMYANANVRVFVFGRVIVCMCVLAHTYVNSCFKLINQSWANFLPNAFHICGLRNDAVAVLVSLPQIDGLFQWKKRIYSKKNKAFIILNMKYFCYI